MRYKVIILILVFSLLIPLTAFAQDPLPAPPVMKKTEDKPEPKQTAEVPKVTPTPSTNLPAKPVGKPLSVNEDPAMIGKRDINKGIIAKMSGSTPKEVAFGAQLAAEVDKQAKFVTDPVLNEYVNRVGQNIVLHSDRPIPFTIKIIDSDEVNAFALPGGYLYVNRGLIMAAGDESELAGVMAHEIGHVAARHGMENQTKATLAQYAIMIPSILLGGGILGGIANQGGYLAALMGFMKFSRQAEEEADRLGVQYLYAAGYDPTGLTRMFEKLESQSPAKKPGLIQRIYADHPDPKSRYEKVRSLLERFPEREEYVISSSEFQRNHAKLMSQTNAMTMAKSQINPNDPNSGSRDGRPTLKRRQPVDPNEPADPDSQTPDTEKKQGPPTMKKRGDPDKP